MNLLFNFVKKMQENGTSIEEILPIFTKLIVDLVNQSNSNTSINVKKDGFGIFLSVCDIFLSKLLVYSLFCFLQNWMFSQSI